MCRLKTFLLLTFSCVAISAPGQIVQLLSPNGMDDARTTFSFDNHSDRTIANTLYQNFGISFGRDDGSVVPLVNVEPYGILTVSGTQILATISYPQIGPTNTGVTHLEVNSLQPLRELGAYFGNDAYIGEFGYERLSIFGASNELLGFVDVAVNDNYNIDQFIGIRSSVPFYRVRFENFTPSGNVSSGRAVAIDDFTFTVVPEPSAMLLAGIGGLCCWLVRRRIRG